MVGAVEEMASMKRRKLWNTMEDGLCCSRSAIQTWLGPSSLLEEWSKTTIVFVASFCCWLPPKLGETAKVYRYRRCIVHYILAFKGQRTLLMLLLSMSLYIGGKLLR